MKFIGTIKTKSTTLATWRRCVRRTGYGMSLVYLLALVASPVTAMAPQYEAPVTLDASQILPGDLIKGKDFSVDAKVLNDGYLNHYTIQSPYGEFKAISTDILRKRIREINAISAMEQVKAGKEFLSSFKQGGMKTLGGAKDLIIHPVRTTYQTIAGVGKVFEIAKDSIFSFKRSDAEGSRFKDVIGFAKVKREYAHQFGVDAYTRNEAVQDRLNDIAWAGYAGGLAMSAAMMPVTGGLGTAISVSRLSRTFDEIFLTVPPTELRAQNHNKLVAMGVHEDIAELFINNPHYTPREQTLIVGALDDMKLTANRSDFIKHSIPANDPVVTHFRQLQAEMYAGYNRTVEPIESFVPLGQFVAANTGEGKLVFNVPLDYLVWTENIAQYVDAANYLISKKPGVTEKHLWVTGSVSPFARQQLIQRGWQISEHNEGQLLGTAKSYPAYEKTTRIPSGTIDVQSTSVALGVGVAWGDGKLRFKGKNYRFSVEGLSLVDLGYSKVSTTGEVYELNRISDFSGTYVAGSASFAVAGGTGEISLTNQKGVVIVARSEQKGTKLSLAASGLKIKLQE